MPISLTSGCPRSQSVTTASPPGEQPDVEHVRPVPLLRRRELVEQQGAHAGCVQGVGDVAVAWTVPAAAAAVREDHGDECTTGRVR